MQPVRPWPAHMTAAMAARYGGVSRWTIYRHVPPSGRRGRTRVYALADVDRWLAGEPLAAGDTATPSAATQSHARDRAPASSRESAITRIRDAARGAR